MVGGGDHVARQLEWLGVISETARAFADTLSNYDALVRIVVERIAVATNDSCMIALISDDGEWLDPVAFHDPDPQVAKIFHAVWANNRLRVGEGPTGTVAKTGVPVLIPLDGERLRAVMPPHILQAVENLGLSSVLVYPLIVRGIVIGTLTLARYGQRPAHDELDRRMIEDLAARSALAIDNARLYRDLEKRVASRTAELEASNHELETLSYSISHDLRAPLRAIDGFARILIEEHGAGLDPEAHRVAGIISTNAERMGVLIDALLSFSRVGRVALARETVDMTELARSVVDEIAAREPARTIDIVVADLPSHHCNALLMRQVWTNLLGNAAKFTRTRERAMVAVNGTRQGDEIVYTIKDNGVGFDMKYASKLFGVFQRMHDATYEGTGVGLALVQRIILRHGGRVWADSTVDKGATFSFALPVEPAKK